MLIHNLFTLIIGSALLVAASSVGFGNSASSPKPLSKATLSRVVFLGDSITDGNTYPQLVRDSLAKSRGIKMLAINAGIGGNTMPQMHDRLQRDVLAYNPTLVTISAGGNDAVRGVTGEQYEAAMRSTVETLLARHIQVILLTQRWPSPAQEVKPVYDEYAAAILKIAADHNLRVADVAKQMGADAAKGLRMYSLDNVHPGYTGQKAMARAVLDAMGYADVPLIDRVAAVIDPDTILDWRIRPLSDADGPLTEATIGTVEHNGDFKTVHLPFATMDYTGADVESLAWLDDLRLQGVAVQLDKNVAPGRRFIAVATVTEKQAKSAVLQSGAEVLNIWLNGKLVQHNDGTRGWHLGRDTSTVQLNAGANELVVETGSNLWVRLGDKPMW